MTFKGELQATIIKWRAFDEDTRRRTKRAVSNLLDSLCDNPFSTDEHRRALCVVLDLIYAVEEPS